MTSKIEAPAGPEVFTKFRSVGFFAADFAAIENGKVYVGGGYWAVLNFPAFPTVLPSMSLVAVIEVPFHANQANHSLEMGMLDADDNSLGFRVEGVFRSAPKIDTPYGEAGTAPVAVPVQGLTFERPGKYSFTLKVDGALIDRYHFRVVQVAQIAVRPAIGSPPLE